MIAAPIETGEFGIEEWKLGFRLGSETDCKEFWSEIETDGIKEQELKSNTSCVDFGRGSEILIVKTSEWDWDQ